MSIVGAWIPGRLVGLLCACLLSACGSLDEAPAHTSRQAYCQALVAVLDDTVAQRGVRDGQDRRVAGYPYLRVNRLLASYRGDVSGADYEQWLDELQALALNGWRYEYRNLPGLDQQQLWQQAQVVEPGAVSFAQVLERCATTLNAADSTDPARRDALREAAVVPDNYSLAKRTFGLYPLTSLGFRRGVSGWHQEVREQYALALDQLEAEGELIFYRPPSSQRLTTQQVAAIVQRAAASSLALPQPPAIELDALFASFAPIFAIDTAGRDDRPGAPRWLPGGRLDVDVRTPVVYRYATHTRYRGRALLQLNYLLWFRARPPTERPDLLAGALDGIVWRVTLRPDGKPLVFDTIHPCGCYHLLFPGPGVSATVQQSAGLEPVLSPPQASLPGAAEPPLVLHVASTTHYVERVSVERDYHPTMEQSAGFTREYQLLAADELRSLDWRADQRRSLYGENGLVSGSERLERFLFWPMGIASAGAMRQPGHQATAFIGRRHFDDADLFDALLQCH